MMLETCAGRRHSSLDNGGPGRETQANQNLCRWCRGWHLGTTEPTSLGVHKGGIDSKEESGAGVQGFQSFVLLGAPLMGVTEKVPYSGLAKSIVQEFSPPSNIILNGIIYKKMWFNMRGRGYEDILRKVGSMSM